MSQKSSTDEGKLAHHDIKWIRFLQSSIELAFIRRILQIGSYFSKLVLNYRSSVTAGERWKTPLQICKFSASSCCTSCDVIFLQTSAIFSYQIDSFSKNSLKSSSCTARMKWKPNRCHSLHPSFQHPDEALVWKH